MTTTAPTRSNARNDWTREEIAALFDLPFTELVFRAAEVHRKHHRPNTVQRSTLLSVKTGGCPEDCGYCSQSAHNDSGLKATKLMEVQQVLQSAAQAKDAERLDAITRQHVIAVQVEVSRAGQAAQSCSGPGI